MENGGPLLVVPCEPHHHRKKIVAREIKRQRAFIKELSTKLEAIKKNLNTKRLLAIPTHVHTSNRRSDSHIKYVNRLTIKYQNGIETLHSVQEHLASLIEEAKQYE